MSEFHIRVVEVREIQKHPHADTLSICNIEGYPVIFKSGDYKEGDLAVYIPIDSIVPDTQQWSFLNGHRRIKAKKLRSIFSMGMLAPIPREVSPTGKAWVLGQNVQKEMGIIKWEPGIVKPLVELDEATIIWNKKPLWKKVLTSRFYRRIWWKLLLSIEALFQPGDITCSQFPVYTDIEGLRRYSNILVPGEEVIITEKTHGQNARFGRLGKKFYVGSHYYFKGKPKFISNEKNNWWNIADSYQFEKILPEGYGFYGEIYGTVQGGFPYDAAGKLAFRCFDILNLRTNRYINYDDFVAMCTKYNIPMVPLLYRGPWKEELKELAEGQSTFGNHVREGFVVKPIKERFEPSIGRCILKFIGQGYLLSKES